MTEKPRELEKYKIKNIDLTGDTTRGKNPYLDEEAASRRKLQTQEENSGEQKLSPEELRTRRRKRAYRISCMVAAIVIILALCYAWYSTTTRDVRSTDGEVMKPYNLSVLNPGETAELQLSVGNLFPGQTKDVMFCVSNKDNTGHSIQMGISDFNYNIDMVYTNNLAITYELYQLTEVFGEGGKEPTSYQYKSSDKDSAGNDVIRYWNITQTTIEGNTDLLSAVDVTTAKRQAVFGEEATWPNAATNLNLGTYMEYTKDVDNNNLMLKGKEAGTNGFDSNFFLLRMTWNQETDFQNYEKETDMIYLLVQALQPEPALPSSTGN